MEATMALCCHARSVRPALLTAAALLCAAWAAVPVRASDVPAIKPAAPVIVKPVEEASADSLAIVQKRLAERLGGQPGDEHGSGSGVLRITARATTVAALAPKASQPAAKTHEAAAHWSYEGDGGPGLWGQLKPEFAACSSGKRQSPIDIRDGMRLALEPVVFDYKPAAFKVHDNGHTIQVNLAPGSGIEVLGQRYELLQFHFHRPSEESIDGKRFDMVAHFVHKNLEGQLAVVAVLIERGAAQSQLQQVWNHLPLEKGDTVAARATIDLAQLLPEQRGYFTYMGSLTTPPCTEDVLWIVMKQPVQASPDQLNLFTRLYPMNARPTQATSGRMIKESN
jgi:carbonic anhydrase